MRHGIAMLAWKKLNSMPLAKFCKGLILSARVYADTPGYKCQCGGVFKKRIPHSDHEDILVPKCNACNKYPPVFHIDADAKDPNGNKIRVKIRNDQNNARLDNISQVIFTLQTIQKEIMEGEFDVTRYVSKEARESFRFKNYVLEYIKEHEARLLKGDITPKGLRDKKQIINKQLVPYFGGHDLTKINQPLILKFQRSYIKNFRTRDLALGELKTILKQAVKDGKLKVSPPFDKIPKANTRENIITLELIHETIAKIPQKLYRDMLAIMTVYPLRPSELRALRWVDVDFIKDEIHIKGHFSDEVWIKGRKSISSGKKSELKYPLLKEIRAILNHYRASRVPMLDRENDFIFKGIHGTHVQDEAFAKAWREARKVIGHEHQMYEIRHRCLTEFGKRHKGDIMKMQKFSGHTNANTLLDRYIHDDSDMRDYF